MTTTQEDKAAEHWTKPQYVLIRAELYFRGGHPEKSESWSPLLADAKRYSRESVHNVREHVSANTSGSSVLWEHEKLAARDLRWRTSNV